MHGFLIGGQPAAENAHVQQLSEVQMDKPSGTPPLDAAVAALAEKYPSATAPVDPTIQAIALDVAALMGDPQDASAAQRCQTHHQQLTENDGMNHHNIAMWCLTSDF